MFKDDLINVTQNANILNAIQFSTEICLQFPEFGTYVS